MKLLAIERDVVGAGGDPSEPLLRREAACVWELYQAGVLRELYFRADQTRAVLVLECASVEEAAAVLGTLPLVEQGRIEFDIIPLVAYPGFARLFGEFAIGATPPTG